MYVRAVNRGTWTRLVSGGGKAIDDVVSELLRQGPHVSVFECSQRQAVELVAVALVATRINRQHFHFVSIAAEDLAAACAVVVRSEGDTALPDANRLHRDLDLSGDRARRLVAHLAVRRVAVETVREEELKRLARALHAAGQPIPEESWLLR